MHVISGIMFFYEKIESLKINSWRSKRNDLLIAENTRPKKLYVEAKIDSIKANHLCLLRPWLYIFVRTLRIVGLNILCSWGPWCMYTIVFINIFHISFWENDLGDCTKPHIFVFPLVMGYKYLFSNIFYPFLFIFAFLFPSSVVFTFCVYLFD